jgi:hypothetical protein
MLKDKLEHIKEVHEDKLGGDFIVSASPLFNSEGKITGCIHVARDINERKQAEKSSQIPLALVRVRRYSNQTYSNFPIRLWAEQLATCGQLTRKAGCLAFRIALLDKGIGPWSPP